MKNKLIYYITHIYIELLSLKPMITDVYIDL